MFIKNRLPMLTLFLLLSNVLMQGMNNSLHNAIKENNYNKFIDLLENKKISPDSLNEHNEPPIFEAAFSKDFRFLQELIKHKVNINATNSSGRIAVSLACYSDETVKNLKLFIKAGVNVEVLLDQDTTAFYEAFFQYIRCKDKTECKEVMRALIEGGANVAIKYNSSHPTLLSYVEDRLKREQDKGQITKYTWLKDLLIKAPQIRADCLSRKAAKQEKNRKMALRIEGNLLAQQRLVKFNSGTIIKIKNEDINTHLPLLVVRCFSALSLINQ